MVKDKWIVVYEKYEGYEEKAINRITGAVFTHTNYVIPAFAAADVNEELLAANNVIFVGTQKNAFLKQFADAGLLPVPAGEQGYTVKVCKNSFNEEKQMILILGFDAAGVLYGAADFENKYVGEKMYDVTQAAINERNFLLLPFKGRMPEYELSETPSFKERGIWTWGHCIYDYKAFFENMATLKLNMAVIWNDHAPINAKQVVDYAHSLGIKVFWGFSWGWRPGSDEAMTDVANPAVIQSWVESVESTYASCYAPSGADGIYFQSFTETAKKDIDGVCIAEIVTRWVNAIGGNLLEKYPDINIQFGLHATSVNDKLEYMKKVDTRIHIVWEDCGAFPYNYDPNHVENFDETTAFNAQICTLRGADEKFGVVYKGMTTLDWSIFEHQSGSFVLGECTENFIGERVAARARIWKYLQASWIRNAAYAARMTKQIHELTVGSGVMQMLVEDGCFEDSIYYPVAVGAEMLWNVNKPADALLAEVAHYPRVKFGNLL